MVLRTHLALVDQCVHPCASNPLIFQPELNKNDINADRQRFNISDEGVFVACLALGA